MTACGEFEITGLRRAQDDIKEGGKKFFGSVREEVMRGRMTGRRLGSSFVDVVSGTVC